MVGHDRPVGARRFVRAAGERTHRRRYRRGERLAGGVFAARRPLSGPPPRTRAGDLHLGPVYRRRPQPAAGGWIDHAWSRSFAHGAAPLGLAGWQAAFLAVGVPGLLLALWVLTLREPARGFAEGQPSPVVRPGAWRAFALELAAILPPVTLWSVARFPGALRRNLKLLAAIAGAAACLARLTGDTLQWGTIGFGSYAVTSWAQMLYATDRPTFALLIGTRAIALSRCWVSVRSPSSPIGWASGGHPTPCAPSAYAPTSPG